MKYKTLDTLTNGAIRIYIYRVGKETYTIKYNGELFNKTEEDLEEQGFYLTKKAND